MTKAKDIPLGSQVRVETINDIYGAGFLTKELDFEGKSVWTSRPGSLTHSSADIVYTDDELDQEKFQVVVVPQGYHIEEYDQGIMFMNAIRKLNSEEFLQLLQFIERL